MCNEKRKTKLLYEQAALEIIELQHTDVIATSTPNYEVEENIPKDDNTWQDNWLKRKNSI